MLSLSQSAPSITFSSRYRIQVSASVDRPNGFVSSQLQPLLYLDYVSKEQSPPENADSFSVAGRTYDKTTGMKIGGTEDIVVFDALDSVMDRVIESANRDELALDNRRNPGGIQIVKDSSTSIQTRADYERVKGQVLQEYKTRVLEAAATQTYKAIRNEYSQVGFEKPVDPTDRGTKYIWDRGEILGMTAF